MVTTESLFTAYLIFVRLHIISRIHHFNLFLIRLRNCHVTADKPRRIVLSQNIVRFRQSARIGAGLHRLPIRIHRQFRAANDHRHVHRLRPENATVVDLCRAFQLQIGVIVSVVVALAVFLVRTRRFRTGQRCTD